MPNKRKRQGGIQQRLGATPASEFSFGTSALSDYLAQQWSEGFLSPQQVQRLASLAMADFSALGHEGPQSLSHLAAIGSHGRHSNNCHRDMVRLLQPKCTLPPGLQIKVPMKLGVSYFQ